jgi:hypothetical protein
MRGYIDHVAEKFVKPVLEAQVIRANGGLIVTRPVGSWLTGAWGVVFVFVFVFVFLFYINILLLLLASRLDMHVCVRLLCVVCASRVGVSFFSGYSTPPTSPNNTPNRAEGAYPGAVTRAGRPPRHVQSHGPRRQALW